MCCSFCDICSTPFHVAGKIVKFPVVQIICIDRTSKGIVCANASKDKTPVVLPRFKRICNYNTCMHAGRQA